jgi:GTPase SAR1 family protein
LISHYRKAVGALLVYDVTKRFTFTDIQRWLSELRQYAEPDCIVMLVGNKFDLIEKNNRKREVTYEEAKAFAEENKLLFYETSALSSYKVNECFEDLLQEIYNERRKVTNVQKQMYTNIVKLATKDKKIEEKKCC